MTTVQSPAATVLAASNLVLEFADRARTVPAEVRLPFTVDELRLLSELLASVGVLMRRQDAVEVEHPDGSRMVIPGSWVVGPHDANFVRADFGDWSAAYGFARQLLDRSPVDGDGRLR